MPLIKPRTRGKQLVKHRTRLDAENNETLYAYAKFLGESTEYVLNQVIDTVLARDKEFVKWREAHDGSFVPRAKQHQRRTKRHHQIEQGRRIFLAIDEGKHGCKPSLLRGPSRGIAIEIAGAEQDVFPLGPGKSFWIGFFVDDNDTPYTDVQRFLQWPATFGMFNPPEDGARVICE